MNFVSSITLAFKDAFSSGFTEAKENLTGMTNALDEINQNQSLNRLAADMAMMTSMTEPMRRALSEAMDQPARIAGSLDSAFRNIQVATGATTEEMSGMRRELLAIGGQAAGGPQAVANAFADITSSVADSSKHMAIMSASISLAEANQADLGRSTSSLIRLMNAFDLSAENAALAADVLTQTARMGSGSVDEFASYIGQISTLAHSAGIGLDELGASFSYLTDMGMSASQAKRQTRYIISSLLKPSDTLAGLYEALGVESGQAMLAQYGLADSLYILRNAMGDDKAFGSMLGNAEVATAALALTNDAYTAFAAEFGEGMRGVTEAARGVQLESIEMKMARLESVSQSLQAQIGQDINGIKGFFIDMRFGFLSNVVTPIMSSPVGGAISKIAAVTGVAAKGILDFGSNAMSAAAQMTTLAANISNAGGIAKMFQSTVGLMGSGLKILASPLKAVGVGFVGLGKSIVGALPAIGKYIISMWAAVAPTLAATWPILAIVGAVALLAGGVFLLIRNWDRVAGFFTGLWERVKAGFAAAWNWIKNMFLNFTPHGLIIKHWDAISGWFVGLWERVKAGFATAWEWIKNMFLNYTPHGLIIKHWETIAGFFTGLWENIKGVFSSALDWISNLLTGVWDGIKTFFTNLWNAPKAAIQGFIGWIGGKVEAFTAPFRAIGNVVSGVFDRVGGFFRGLTGGGRDSGTALNDAFADGIQSNADAPGAAFSDSLQSVGRQMPHSDAPEGPLSQLTASGRALTETFASGMDENILRERADTVFSAIMPQSETLEIPSIENTGKQGGSQTIHIQNLYLQADECQSLFDFVRMIMHSVERPEEAFA